MAAAPAAAPVAPAAVRYCTCCCPRGDCCSEPVAAAPVAAPMSANMDTPPTASVKTMCRAAAVGAHQQDGVINTIKEVWPPAAQACPCPRRDRTSEGLEEFFSFDLSSTCVYVVAIVSIFKTTTVGCIGLIFLFQIDMAYNKGIHAPLTGGVWTGDSGAPGFDALGKSGRAIGGGQPPVVAGARARWWRGRRPILVIILVIVIVIVVIVVVIIIVIVIVIVIVVIVIIRFPFVAAIVAVRWSRRRDLRDNWRSLSTDPFDSIITIDVVLALLVFINGRLRWTNCTANRWWRQRTFE